MVTEQQRNIIKILIEKGEIKTSELKAIGIGAKEINNLIAKGDLTRVKRGYYSYNNVAGIYNYAFDLLRECKQEEASVVFEKVYEMDRSYKNALFQLFWLHLRIRDFESAYKDIKRLSANPSPDYVEDYNFYFFILSYFYQMPEEDVDFVKGLKPEDVFVKESGARSHLAKYNGIRSLMMEERFVVAQKELNKMSASQQRIFEVFLNQVLNMLIVEQRISKIAVKELSMEGEYEQAKEILLKANNQRALSMKDQNVLRILDLICDARKGAYIHSTLQKCPDDIYVAISRKNYDYAFKLACERAEFNKMNPQNEILCILLNALLDLIHAQDLDRTPNKDMVRDFLTNRNYYKGFKELKHVLKEANLDKYYKYLVCIALLEELAGNLAFFDFTANLMRILTQGAPMWSAKTVEGHFYDSIESGEVLDAYVYYEMLKELTKMGSENIDIEKAHDTLCAAYNPEEITGRSVLENYGIASGVNFNYTLDLGRAWYEKKVEELVRVAKETGEVQFFTLKNTSFTGYIDKMLNKYPEVSRQIVAMAEGNQIVIKTYSPKSDYDPSFTLKTADELYNDKNFALAKKLYLNVLNSQKEFDKVLMIKIALCHVCEGHFEIAKKYLSFAKLQYGYGAYEIDLEELIASFDANDISLVASKVAAVSSEVSPDTLEVPCAHEIAYLMLTENLSLEEACSVYKLDERSINKIRLMYAEYAYTASKVEMGDSLVSQIIESGVTSKTMNAALEELVACKLMLPARGENIPNTMRALILRGL